MRHRFWMGAAIVVLMCVCVPAIDYAQTTVSGPSGPMTAVISSDLEFSLARVVQLNADAGETDPFNQGVIQSVPNFNFGSLRKVTDNNGNVLYMRGQYYYYVLMIVSSTGRRYMITETGTPLIGGGGASLPLESVLLIPDYQWLDELGGAAQGTPPSGAYVGPPTSASKVNSVIYQSDTAGQPKLVRAILTIGGPQAGSSFPSNYSLGHNGSAGQGALQQHTLWTPVTPSQPSGTYSGTATFTLVLN